MRSAPPPSPARSDLRLGAGAGWRWSRELRLSCSVCVATCPGLLSCPAKLLPRAPGELESSPCRAPWPQALLGGGGGPPIVFGKTLFFWGGKGGGASFPIPSARWGGHLEPGQAWLLSGRRLWWGLLDGRWPDPGHGPSPASTCRRFPFVRLNAPEPRVTSPAPVAAPFAWRAFAVAQPRHSPSGDRSPRARPRVPSVSSTRALIGGSWTPSREQLARKNWSPCANVVFQVPAAPTLASACCLTNRLGYPRFLYNASGGGGLWAIGGDPLGGQRQPAAQSLELALGL